MGVRLVLVSRNRILTVRYSAVGGEAHNSPRLEEKVHGHPKTILLFIIIMIMIMIITETTAPKLKV